MCQSQGWMQGGEKGSRAFPSTCCPARNQNVLPSRSCPGWPGIASSPPSLAAAGQKELADAVFYQLLWKPAAILIISSSRIGQVLLPSAQPRWPRGTGWTCSTWQGHVERDPVARAVQALFCFWFWLLIRNSCLRILLPADEPSDHIFRNLLSFWSSPSQSSSAEIHRVEAHLKFWAVLKHFPMKKN